ncbi:MAG: hypothetical protein VKK03_01675 [Synechococcus sp.]|nr:hypothetical protein [Synechococcus sp.]
MSTVLNHRHPNRTPVVCGLVSVLAATALGCGAAVGSVLVLDTVLLDPLVAAEPTVLLVLLAGSAWRERTCRKESVDEPGQE